MLRSLVEIFEDQGGTTDKLTVHDYPRYYEKLFGPIRKTAKAILEIGIAQGGSLRAWEEYFVNANVYGLDNKKQFVAQTVGERIYTFNIDVGNRKDLQEWADRPSRMFDVIIDDGSHIASEILTAYRVLWDCVTKGGYYIIEDARQGSDPDRVYAYFKYGGKDIQTRLYPYNLIVLQKRV